MEKEQKVVVLVCVCVCVQDVHMWPLGKEGDIARAIPHQ